jgi:Transmembrane secretion effector
VTDDAATGLGLGWRGAAPQARPVTRKRARRRPLHDLLIGQAVSSLGDWMGTVALMALVLHLTGSATAVGGVLVLRLAPTVLAGPLAARLTTRWSRRKIMLATDAVRVPVVALLPWVTHLWWIYPCAFVAELAGMVFLPARDASIPDLVEDDDDLAVANGLVLASSYGMIPIGAGVFALIAALVGSDGGLVAARLIFALDALTFVVSFVAISRLPELGAAPAPGPAPGAVTPVVAAPDAGFLSALRIPLVRRLAPVAAAVAVGLGALFSLGIVWVREVLGASETQFGLLVASFGVGAGVALLVLRRLRRRGLATVRVLLVAQGATVASMSLAPTIAFALLGAVVFGGLSALILALAMELPQNELAPRERVLAFTVFHVVIRGGLAVAAIGAGVADDVLDEVRWPFVGHLVSTQVVLLSSGLLVVLVALGAGRATAVAEPRH